MPFKIAEQFRPKQDIVVDILSPLDGTTPTGLAITLHGRYTKAFHDAQMAAYASVEEGATAEDVMRAVLAHAIKGWTGVVDADDVAVVPTPAVALELFREAGWLYEQLRARFNKAQDFFEPAKAS